MAALKTKQVYPLGCLITWFGQRCIWGQFLWKKVCTVRNSWFYSCMDYTECWLICLLCLFLCSSFLSLWWMKLKKWIMFLGDSVSNSLRLHFDVSALFIKAWRWGTLGEGSSCHLVVDEEFEPVLGVLELQEAFKEHCDKGRGLLNEDANHHQRVFTLLLEKNKHPGGVPYYFCLTSCTKDSLSKLVNRP